MGITRVNGLETSKQTLKMSNYLNSIVDLHSHLGVDAAPALSGANDGNSRHGIVQPWLRALDGLNTHDDAYHLSISGGVTTALVLPGSANGIGKRTHFYCIGNLVR